MWRAALCFDSYVLAPPRAGESFLAAVKRRLTLFLSGDTSTLLAERRPRSKPATAPPTMTTADVDDSRAARAQQTLLRFKSITGAMKRLRAPIATTPITPVDSVAAMKKLNPQIGDAVSPPAPFHLQGGGDVAPPTPPPVLPTSHRHTNRRTTTTGPSDRGASAAEGASY